MSVIRAFVLLCFCCCWTNGFVVVVVVVDDDDAIHGHNNIIANSQPGCR